MPIDTKRTIAEAFIQLAHQKSLDKITIKDIVDRCSISRQAFYYHFQDVLDVIEWIVQKEMQRALEECLKRETLREALLYFIQQTIENKGLIKRLVSSQHGEQIQHFLMQAFCQMLREIRSKRRMKMNLPTVEEDTTLRFLAFGMVGLIDEAIRSGNCDAEFLCDEIYAIVMRILDDGIS